MREVTKVEITLCRQCNAMLTANGLSLHGKNHVCSEFASCIDGKFTKMCSGYELVLVAMKLSDFMELEEGKIKIQEKPYFVSACDFYSVKDKPNKVFDLAKEWGKKIAIESTIYFKILNNV